MTQGQFIGDLLKINYSASVYNDKDACHPTLCFVEVILQKSEKTVGFYLKSEK